MSDHGGPAEAEVTTAERDDRRPCRGRNGNVCVAEGCYGGTCLTTSAGATSGELACNGRCDSRQSTDPDDPDFPDPDCPRHAPTPAEPPAADVEALAKGRMWQIAEEAEFAHVEYALEGDWLVQVVNEHTCGTGPGGYYGAHEPGCGSVPVANIAALLADVRRDAGVKALNEAADALDDHTACDCEDDDHLTRLAGSSWLRDRAARIREGRADG